MLVDQTDHYISTSVIPLIYELNISNCSYREIFINEFIYLANIFGARKFNGYFKIICLFRHRLLLSVIAHIFFSHGLLREAWIVPPL